MKTKVILAALLAGSLAASAAAQQGQPGPGAGGPGAGAGAPGAGARPAGPPRSPLPPPEPIQRVTGNVYKIFGGGGNTLVVVQNDGVVLVDTKMPGNGQYIVDQLATITDKPVKLIISTHSHPDHIGSTDFLREKYPNARIVMARGAEAELARGNAALRPTEYYDGEKTSFFSGADKIDVYHTGVGHTGGDSFVVVPSARLLFMGDVMAWNMAPFLPSGGATAITEETEKLVRAVQGQVDIVVEGHGHVNDWAGLVRLSRFNRALLTAAKAAYDRGDAPGVAVAELQKNPDFAVLLGTQIKKGLEYGNSPLARAHMNVNVAFQEFAGERVTTANGTPLPATEKHKASDPKDTAAPTPAMLAAAVAK